MIIDYYTFLILNRIITFHNFNFELLAIKNNNTLSYQTIFIVSKNDNIFIIIFFVWIYNKDIIYSKIYWKIIIYKT